MLSAYEFTIVRSMLSVEKINASIRFFFFGIQPGKVNLRQSFFVFRCSEEGLALLSVGVYSLTSCPDDL